VEDREDRPAKRWGGQYIKDRLQPVLYWFLRYAPGPVALFPFHALAVFMNSIYWLQRNQLRRSSEA
jgi:hypothetical protein